MRILILIALLMFVCLSTRAQYNDLWSTAIPDTAQPECLPICLI